jgi:ATPase family associated with various cellular activities (AAA)
MQYAGDHSDKLDQMWSNPRDNFEPDIGSHDNFLPGNAGRLISKLTDESKLPHLSKSKPRIPRFELGPGVVKVPYETDSRTADLYIMHYVHPRPLVVYTEMHLYRACAVGITGRGEAQKGVLASFCKHALEWKMDLDDRRAGEDHYMLFRCKTSKMDERVWWSNEGIKIARSLDKLYLPEAEKEELIADLRHFLSPKMKHFYLSNGLPYRRSVLLYGPPGTGKTTTIRAAAGHFRLYVACLVARNYIVCVCLDRFLTLSPRCPFHQTPRWQQCRLSLAGEQLVLEPISHRCVRSNAALGFWSNDDFQRLTHPNLLLLRALSTNSISLSEIPGNSCLVIEDFDSLVSDTKRLTAALIHAGPHPLASIIPNTNTSVSSNSPRLTPLPSSSTARTRNLGN